MSYDVVRDMIKIQSFKELQERVAEMQYEAGMYQSLYELAKEHTAKLVADLEQASGWRDMAEDAILDRDKAEERNAKLVAALEKADNYINREKMPLLRRLAYAQDCIREALQQATENL